MRDSLIIVHSTEGKLAPVDFDDDCWLRWNTCMRQIAMGFGNERPVGYSVFSGREAYEFFLEVVSGLHSPIIGETEVMGQFRELFETASKSTFKNKSLILNFFRNILTDAKVVRAVALKDLGSRSYGSLIRKYLKESKNIEIWGAGKLTAEILPWVRHLNLVTVKGRRLEQRLKLKEKFNFVRIEDFYSPMMGDTLIVAAPMTSAEIKTLLTDAPKVRLVIDFRETSSQDILNLNIPTISLSQLFSEIGATGKDLELKVIKAQTLIKELSHKWIFAAENRPFGWEDLCG